MQSVKCVGVGIGRELDFRGRFRRSIESADVNLPASVAGCDNALVPLVAQVTDCAAGASDSPGALPDPQRGASGMVITMIAEWFETAT